MRASRNNPRSAPSSRIVALSLAEEFLASGESDAAYREEILDTALMVGSWLAEKGRPGRWDTIEIEALTESIGFSNNHDRDGFLLALSGLIGYAGIVGQLSAPRTRGYFREIVALAAAPLLADFLGGAEEFFVEPLN
ncbi:MAG: hypothetical protein SGI86_13680 [Deltaproteobacteria bacterium]|nr:hypothetical protein [Deltaproteobacteria bacterium]